MDKEDYWGRTVSVAGDPPVPVPVFNFDQAELDKIKSMADLVSASTSPHPKIEESHPLMFQAGDAVQIKILIAGWKTHKLFEIYGDRLGIIIKVIKDNHTGFHSYITLFGTEKFEMFQEEICLLPSLT